MKKENAVVIVVNQSYAKYARSLINSIKVNWPSHPLILVYLNIDVQESYYDYFSSLTLVKPIRFDPKQYEYRNLLVDDTSWFGSKSFHDTGYFILNFWDTKFDEFENLLILDADMLVLKSLDEIINQSSFFGVSANNERLFPVFSISGGKIKKTILGIKYWLKSALNGVFLIPKQSLNSGVILLTPRDRTRKNYIFLLSLLKEFKSVCPTDQEIILLWALKNQRNISTDFRFNFQIRFYNLLKENKLKIKTKNKIKEALSDVHILHFNGLKPDHPEFAQKGWGKNRFELIDLYSKFQFKEN